MSINKPSHEEEEYFAKEEANRRQTQALERARQMQAAELEQLKKLHWMHCPKCGFQLETIKFKGLNIDKCFHCNGTWLDAGELETLAGKEPDLLERIVAVFRRG
jgi:predicted Zn-ribbon and HTH transcriptional regulator